MLSHSSLAAQDLCQLQTEHDLSSLNEHDTGLHAGVKLVECHCYAYSAMLP